MRCFYCENIEEGEFSVSILERRERDHLFKVLRGRVGDAFNLIDGCGRVAEAELSGKKSIRVDSVALVSGPNVKIHLFVAPPGKQRMDAMLSQCSEVGVWRIATILTERGVSIPKGEGASTRMRSRLIEGCKQSNNPFIPELLAPLPFNDAVALAAENCDLMFYGAPAGEVDNPTEGGETAEKRSKQSLDIAWFVGPEGGFTDAEMSSLNAAGVIPFNIGNWILRVETAAVVGAALLIRKFSHCYHSKQKELNR